MMIQEIYDLAEDVLNTEDHVRINYENVEKLGKKMLSEGIQPFFIQNDTGYQTGIYIEILKELVASSINYCYWYGCCDIRPNGSSSTKMYDIVNCEFKNIGVSNLKFDYIIDNIIKRLSKNKFPLIEERKRHLYELIEKNGELFAKMVKNKTFSGKRLFEFMIENFQGFASDMFSKRACLFFIQLYRKYDWWKDDLMKIIPIPADYQVPKMLRHYGCIELSEKLNHKIANHKIIHKHSIEEVKIRAATITVCKQLQEITNWLTPDIDTYLWMKRKTINIPFHLTYTTDY